jgi:geranylgeranyl diphosphate synthase type I
MLEEVMYGQYLDVMGTGRDADDVEAALRIVRYKTATATIEWPLQLGAAVTGADEATMEVFTRLGRPLGEAFQLRDDLLDVFGSADGACAPGLSDLREGKRTVLLALALRNKGGGRHHRERQRGPQRHEQDHDEQSQPVARLLDQREPHGRTEAGPPPRYRVSRREASWARWETTSTAQPRSRRSAATSQNRR